MSTIISFKAVSDRGLSKEAVGMGGRIIVVLGTTVKAELKERQLKARRRNRVNVFIVMLVSTDCMVASVELVFTVCRRKTRVDCVKRQAVENVKDFLVPEAKIPFQRHNARRTKEEVLCRIESESTYPCKMESCKI
jgi:hypothetical protein